MGNVPGHDDTKTATPEAVLSSDQLGLPTVARLYYTGYGSRRYKRASVRSGPGEPLTFVSLADERVRRAVVAERERCAALSRADAGQLDQHRQPERPAAQLTEAETLAAAREKAHNAADAAERAWYEYAGMLEVGNDRTRAFAVYENLRCARRL
jgi:hypothetical protein